MKRDKDRPRSGKLPGSKKSLLSKSKPAVRTGYREQEVNGYLLFIFFTLLITVILSYNIPSRSIPSYQLGDICRWDIKAPAELMVLDNEQTDYRRKQAAKNVLPVFDFDNDTFNQVVLEIQNVISKWRTQIQNEELAIQAAAAAAEIATESDADNTRVTAIKPTAIPTPSVETRLEEFNNELGTHLSLPAFHILMKHKFSKELEAKIAQAFNFVYSNGVVISRKDFLKEVEQGFARRDLLSGQENTIASTDSILDMKSVKQYIEENVDTFTMGDKEILPLLKELILTTLKPNLTLNKQETQTRIKAARNSVKNVMLQAKTGEIIVREGDRIEDTHLLFLREIGSLQAGENQLLIVSGTFIILAVMGILYLKYLKVFRPIVYNDRKYLYIISTISILILLSTRLFLVLSKILSSYFDYAPFDTIIPYVKASPFAAASLIIALLVDTPAALIYGIYQGVSAGIMTGGDFTATMIALLGSVCAVLGITRHKRRTDIIRAGLIICLVNVFVVFGLALATNSFFIFVTPFDMFCGFAGGVLVVLIVSTLMPALESLFRITTDIRLAELSSFDHPLIKQMILNAPGTHQHSILVGSLAEAAAEAVGANALLARVASYFHDIGKIRTPYYFIENLGNKLKNLHSKLSPNLSGLVIISHVKEGVDMAKKAKLGKPIIDIIKEHHGTRVIHYFYQKALASEHNSNNEPSPESFKYPGPKPSSKESAIVLLADQVEAASRTLASPTHAKIKSLVKKIINDNLIDEQFENCDLTLKDMGKISDSFVRLLTAMFHHRIDYPGIQFDKEEKPENIHLLKRLTDDTQ